MEELLSPEEIGRLILAIQFWKPYFWVPQAEYQSLNGGIAN